MSALAIDRNEFVAAISEGATPFFQPIISAATDEVIYEVLGRMRMGDTMLYPGQFLPLLEETNSQAAFDCEILVKAIRQAAQWHRETGSYVHIHVNAEQATLEDAGYVPLVREMLRAYELPPETLTVEILETCEYFWENATILRNLRALRKTGIRIAIDDFPTCKDPEGLLAWMNEQEIGDFHVLKIDRSLVQKACNPNDEISVLAREEIIEYVEFAKNAGMRVVAEGVEHDDEVDLIYGLGIDEIQGFVFGKPEPAERAYHLTHQMGTIHRIQQPTQRSHALY